jgi:hypothetical protein
MSWSIQAAGATPYEALAQVQEQVKWSLAPKPHGLDHDGERESVHRVVETIFQVLRTYDQTAGVSVSASGHISFDDYETKSGARQFVRLDIQPWTPPAEALG